MTCKALVVCALSIGPAHADRVTIVPTDSLEHFAVAVIENRRGLYNAIETHDTPYGPVSIEYLTTNPSKVGDPASADDACVVSLPDGVVAVPMCVTIMEQEHGEIRLMLFLGG